MEWGNPNHKPGRPKTRKQDPPVTDEEYTKQELTVYQNGFKALAAAVYKQWLIDGSPAESKEQVEIWKKIAEAL